MGTDVKVPSMIYCCPITDKLKEGIKELRIVGHGYYSTDQAKLSILSFMDISHETYQFLKDKIDFAMPIGIYYPAGYIDNKQHESDFKIVHKALIEIFPECLKETIIGKFKYIKNIIDKIKEDLKNLAKN